LAYVVCVTVCYRKQLQFKNSENDPHDPLIDDGQQKNDFRGDITEFLIVSYYQGLYYIYFDYGGAWRPLKRQVWANMAVWLQAKVRERVLGRGVG